MQALIKKWTTHADTLDVAAAAAALWEFLAEDARLLTRVTLRSQRETPLGSDAPFTRLICDVLDSLRPLARQHRVSLEDLGDLNTLPERIQAEVAGSKGVVSWVSLVGAWSRKPKGGQKRQQHPSSLRWEATKK